MRTFSYFAFAIAGLCACTGNAHAQSPKTFTFSGYEWVVRGSGRGGPGPNTWSPDTVFLDEKGQLHLKIRKVSIPATATEPARDEWQCAELSTKQKLGYGLYEFQVIGAIDRFDRNVVLGLFDYPNPEDGTDGTNEIDIEFAQWGNENWPNGNYTIYPASGPQDRTGSYTFRFRFPDSPTPPLTTHRFLRKKDAVTLESFVLDAKKTENPVAKWRYNAATPTAIPQKALPVHINLWLFQGKPPANGKEVEIILTRFAFTPGAP